MTVKKDRQARRPYYSARTGMVSDRAGIDLPALKRAFRHLYNEFEKAGYFQEAFGEKVSAGGWRLGKLGDVRLHIQRRLHKQNLWSVQDHLDLYSEDDLFDMIELLFDHTSKGLDKTPASYLGNGGNYRRFDQKLGRREFRAAVNDLLADYDKGYELTTAGEIRALPYLGMDSLMAEKLHHPDASNVVKRVESAKQKFLRRGSTVEDHRDAVRDLAGVLEFVRDQARSVLNKRDEKDLFQLANEFGIRHHHQNQKTDYDEEVWLSWMFYYQLATIHACARLLEKAKSQSNG